MARAELPEDARPFFDQYVADVREKGVSVGPRNHRLGYSPGDTRFLVLNVKTLPATPGDPWPRGAISVSAKIFLKGVNVVVTS